MKKLLLLFVSIFLFAIISCTNSLDPDSKNAPSPDPRFTGTWSGSDTWGCLV